MGSDLVYSGGIFCHSATRLVINSQSNIVIDCIQHSDPFHPTSEKGLFVFGDP